MRVLLLGADGFLGRHVAERLLADPAVQLTALGRRDDSDVRFDLSSGSPGALARFLDAVHPGVVVNCAGTMRGGARELVRHNTVAVATVCEALRRSSCGARLVHLGCSAEYGPSPSGASTPEEAVPRPGGPHPRFHVRRDTEHQVGASGYHPFKDPVDRPGHAPARRRPVMRRHHDPGLLPAACQQEREHGKRPRPQPVRVHGRSFAVLRPQEQRPQPEQYPEIPGPGPVSDLDGSEPDRGDSREREPCVG